MAEKRWITNARKSLEKKTPDELMGTKENVKRFDTSISNILVYGKDGRTLNADETKEVDGLTGSLSFSIINLKKLKEIYEKCKKKLIDLIRIHEIYSNHAPDGEEEVEEQGIARRNLDYMYLVYVFIHMLITRVYEHEFDEPEIKNMFRYVYNNVYIEEIKNQNLEKESINSLIDDIIDLVKYIEPNFMCTKRDRTTKKSILKDPLKLRQKLCIQINLLNDITYNDEDKELHEEIQGLKLNTGRNKLYVRESFLQKSTEVINLKLGTRKFDEHEKTFQDVIYTTLEAKEDGLCKMLEEGTKKFGNVKIEFGIDLDTFKFVIFRWGRWREFDPINYVIKVDISGDEDKELRNNPLNENLVYQRTPYYYHTVLRKLDRICKDGTNNNQTVFYYSIIYRTFFRQGDCEPVKIYSKVLNEMAGCASMKKRINCVNLNTEFENYSKFRINIAKTILNRGIDRTCRNTEEFLFPFVQEFYGAMDEITADGDINMVEKMIFNQEDINETISNYTPKKETAAEDKQKRAAAAKTQQKLKETIEAKRKQDIQSART